MKNTMHLKSSRGLLIAMMGILMPLAAAHAYDTTPGFGERPGTMQKPGDMPPPMPDSSMSEMDSTMQNDPPAAGQQGPIRSETNEDQWSSRRESGRNESWEDKNEKKDEKLRQPMWKSNTAD